MTKLLEQAIAQVRELPEDEQDAVAARVIELVNEKHGSSLRLTEAQAAEVRRRLAEKNPKILSLAEFNERMRQRYGV
jgi:hypothetical protein